jgi:hypothetical protein
MSQENVELVRKAVEDWNRGDLDAASEFWDDDVVLRTGEGWPERVFFGRHEVRSFWDGYAETMGHDTVIEELIDAGGSVVMRTRAHVSGDQSGIEGDLVSTMVLTVRKGKAGLDPTAALTPA